MVGKILRGALVGSVLGLLIGVALSGAMYMFNYMRGDTGDIAKGMVAQGVKADSSQLAPVLSVNANGVSDTSSKLIKTLKENGITGLAKQTASVVSKGDVNYEENSGDEKNQEETAEEEGLANNLIRFHVRANSNQEVDIALKYKVRDAVISCLEEGLTSCVTLDEAEDYLADNLELIKQVSEETLSKEGYNYAVRAYLTNDYFPMRQYGEMVVPAGFYQALRVDIGLANGENFWCLLYPTLCVPVEAGGVITKDGEKELQEELTEEQYDKLFVKKEVPKENIEIRFKLWDMLFGED
ncbi:MAG: hypothetical protein E7257_04190 [Lachnospiraceae bacterium]|nr:hypothetical protein [Lachnospiraceae bacterium]MBQ9935436.1 stage II sporulation protein R [Lachnospiraceae bacterium]